MITQRAIETGAVNLSQGFPDFDPPDRLKTLLAEQVARGRNQYALMIEVEALREQIALLFARALGRTPDPGTEITITLGAGVNG